MIFGLFSFRGIPLPVIRTVPASVVATPPATPEELLGQHHQSVLKVEIDALDERSVGAL